MGVVRTRSKLCVRAVSLQKLCDAEDSTLSAFYNSWGTTVVEVKARNEEAFVLRQLASPRRVSDWHSFERLIRVGLPSGLT